MANQIIQVPTDSTGKKVDTSELTVAAQTVQRQRVNIADPTTDTGIAAVDATLGLAVNPTDRALRDMGKIDIAGFDVALPSGTNNIGDVDVLTLPVGQQAMAASTPVVIASNQTVIPVSDNAGSLTVDNPILSIVGGGTEAAAQRVTIANDSTGVLSVDDNGGSLTVDGTVAISGTVTVDSELPAAAALADNTANPTVPGVGAYLMAFDGTNWDRVQTGAAAGGALKVDGSAVTQPVSDAAGSLTVDNPTLSVTGGGVEATALRVTIATDSTGVLSVDDNGGSLTIDGSVAITAVVPGTAATSLGKAEDAGHTSGDVGVMSLAVRKDTGASLADTDLDYAPLQLDSSGNLRVNVAAGGAGDGSILDGAVPSIKATVFDFVNSNPLGVVLRDTNGDYVTAGGGTEYTEDVAAPADPLGKAIIGRRRDTLVTTEVDADGDNIAINATNKGQLHVFPASVGTMDGVSPAVATLVAGTDGYQLRGLRTSSIGNLCVNIDKMPELDLESIKDLTINVSPADDAKFSVEGRPDGQPLPVVIVPSPGASWDKQAYYAQTTTVKVLKNQPGDLGGYYIYNPNATVSYVQFFDLTGPITLGTTTPDWSIGIPATSAANLSIVGGLKFNKGIQLACTTTATGNTAPGTGLDVNLFYK